MTVTATPIPILADNYAWLLRDEETGTTAVVDPAEAGPIAEAIERAGRLDMILITHHHDDHIAAVDEIRARFRAPVVGNAADAHRLPRLDRQVRPGERFPFGAAEAEVIDTPGHTVGHVSYVVTPGDVLLCGDVLFSLGCGRLGDGGTAAQMFESLRRLAGLPGDTLVCCGHEYTASNARFALTVEPENALLAARAKQVEGQRAKGQPTVPTRIADELACNPFLHAPDANAFAAMRARKDSFR